MHYLPQYIVFYIPHLLKSLYFCWPFREKDKLLSVYSLMDFSQMLGSPSLIGSDTQQYFLGLWEWTSSCPSPVSCSLQRKVVRRRAQREPLQLLSLSFCQSSRTVHFPHMSVTRYFLIKAFRMMLHSTRRGKCISVFADPGLHRQRVIWTHPEDKGHF